jgi:DNA-binding MarR family transcriptional regulator
MVEHSTIWRIDMTTLNSTILRDIGAIARTVQSRSDVAYRAIGLQKGQFVFLTRICEHPGLNQNQLSDLVRVDKTTTTKAVQKLETLGYIDKETDAADARSRRLSPTDKALDIYEFLIADENAVLDRCLAGLEDEEVRIAADLLSRLRKNLDAFRQGEGA